MISIQSSKKNNYQTSKTLSLVASTIKLDAKRDVQNARNFLHVDYVMMKLNRFKKWIPERIIRSIDMLLRRLDALTVRMSRNLPRHVKNAKLNLLDIFVMFAFFMIMILKGKRFFIVKDVEFVVLEAGRIFFIVMFVNVVLLSVNKLLINV